MSEGMLAAVAAVAAVLVTLAQWFFSSRAASRQRDVEMTQWGQDVIDVMAEIEMACCPLSTETTYGPGEFERLSQRASALIDKGRLFFPNVKEADRGTVLGLTIGWPLAPYKGKSPEGGDNEGTRVEVLDHVLKAHYVARHLALAKDGDRKTLRQHIWQSRQRFIELMQKEAGATLVRRVAKPGADVDKDPREWEPPTRRLTLS